MHYSMKFSRHYYLSGCLDHVGNLLNYGMIDVHCLNYILTTRFNVKFSSSNCHLKSYPDLLLSYMLRLKETSRRQQIIFHTNFNLPHVCLINSTCKLVSVEVMCLVQLTSRRKNLSPQEVFILKIWMKEEKLDESNQP